MTTTFKRTLTNFVAARIELRNARASRYEFAEKTVLQQKLEAEMLDREFYAFGSSSTKPTTPAAPAAEEPYKATTLRLAA